jgi:hypothetical protein
MAHTSSYGIRRILPESAGVVRTFYQTLLNVQRSLLNAQDSEVQAHVDVLIA